VIVSQFAIYNGIFVEISAAIAFFARIDVHSSHRWSRPTTE
jgi:hypothetical protein